ncbi:MAG TPA: NAD-dependent epimerase/dehydratase family protein, partial [Trueperaceae bacterium]
VTGGAGFIGSHVVDAYLNAGHEVLVADDLSCGHRENVDPRAKFYRVDVRSQDMAELIAKEKPEVVNHHAAQKSVPASVADPVHDADINVLGLLNVLRASADNGVSRVLFASTGGALAGTGLPSRETEPPQLLSAYAVSKYTGETYLDYFSRQHGLEYAVLRYANVYGPRQVAEGECGVVPIFMDNLMADRPSTLFAYQDMPRGSTRDYVHVRDLAHANLLALTRGTNEVMNIGSSQEVHIADIYDMLLEISGKNQPLVRARERPGDLRRSVLDSCKARELLGWSPTIGLQDGLEETWSSFQA